MRVTALDPSIVAGQGCIGSKELGSPNPAPGVGPVAGVDAAIPSQIVSDAATTGATNPPSYPISGSTAEPDSQYDTIDPIPGG